ncbi:hypothetical protein FSP39_004497 [Pinctada imbricata]|uniref:B box-type domain-containing protein n=1 Tax=Pinctada imbricata TaxID=66713 RepID=A0AA88YCW4_PINIB|nr:hypothetical protein FSP39_004497 [Pinctada imbricata]
MSSQQELNNTKSDADENAKKTTDDASCDNVGEEDAAKALSCYEVQKAIKSKFSCELCDTFDKVNSHCMECNQNICNACCRIHSRTKSASGHSVVDIKLWERFSKDVECHNHPVCPEHPNKVYHLSLYCSNCMEMVCGYCRKNLRRPPEPQIEGLPELTGEEKKLQELYLQLEYYKEVEKMILLDQGIDTRKTPEKPMMADKVKEFMKKFTNRIDKIRKEMITKVNTHYEEEKQVSLEYTYRDKIDALEEKIEAYNQKLFDHSKAKYMNAAKGSGIDLTATYKAIDRERENEKKAAAERAELDKREREEVVNEVLQDRAGDGKGEKLRRRVRSPTFIPGEMEEDQIKEMIQEYILNGETPELIAKEEALIREMFGKLEYEIVEEREDGVTEVTKIKHLGDELKFEDIEKSVTENTENMEEIETKENTENVECIETEGKVENVEEIDAKRDVPCDTSNDAENNNDVKDSKDNKDKEEDQ